MISHSFLKRASMSGGIVGVILVDQLSKIWATSLGWSSLNSGIAFGVAPELGLVVSGLGLFLVGWWLWRNVNQETLYSAVILGMVLGGGISNLLDRVRLGGVQDWLVVPVVGMRNNVADYAIVLGLIVWVGMRLSYFSKTTTYD